MTLLTSLQLRCERHQEVDHWRHDGRLLHHRRPHRRRGHGYACGIANLIDRFQHCSFFFFFSILSLSLGYLLCCIDFYFGLPISFDRYPSTLNQAFLPDSYSGGISLLLIDRNAPGVKVRKMETQFDNAHSTTMVTLEDVRVPVQNLIGEVRRYFSILNFSDARVSHRRKMLASC